MSDQLRILIDLTACRGARECMRRAPRTFMLDARGKAVADGASPDATDAILDAARSCPNFAVQVWRGGRKLV